MKEAIEAYLSRGGTMNALFDYVYRTIYAGWCAKSWQEQGIGWRTLPELSSETVTWWCEFVGVTTSAADMFRRCVEGHLDAAEAAKSLSERMPVSSPDIQRWIEGWAP